jgi:hypothetical protein
MGHPKTEHALNTKNAEFLASLFDYKSETGELRWKVKNSNRAPIGSKAGSVDGRGYVIVGVCGVRMKAHRVAWAIYHGEYPPDHMQIDHINGVRTDNRIQNLRLCNNMQNQINSKRRNRTGFRGVCLMPDGNYLAYITVCKQRKCLGRFATPEAAAAARDSEAIRHHGEFAMLNFK